MEVIDEIQTAGGGLLQLCNGDLAALPGSHKIDLLVVSAFPGNYDPVSKTLIADLLNAGISVQDLAKNKAADLTELFDCWLSQEIKGRYFERIMCFEPEEEKNPYTVIAGLFQGMMAFSSVFTINTVAMPLLLTGNRGAAAEKVMKELITTGLFWLDKGFPIRTIKIVIRDADKLQALKSVFETHRNQYLKKSRPARYDFFISYSRRNENFARMIYEKLKDRFSIFLDTTEIGIGVNWVNKLNTSLESSERFIVCISGDYLLSRPCKYEFTYCNLVFINKGDEYVLPVYLYSAELPFPFQVLNYHDAREGAMEKVEAFCDRLIEKYAAS